MQHRHVLAMAIATALLLGRARPALAQDLTWNNGLTFYLDNTEFFNQHISTARAFEGRPRMGKPR